MPSGPLHPDAYDRPERLVWIDAGEEIATVSFGMLKWDVPIGEPVPPQMVRTPEMPGGQDKPRLVATKPGQRIDDFWGEDDGRTWQLRRREGRPQLYRSQWGGMWVVRAFFFGPQFGQEYCKSLAPVDYLLDEVWCEGAAVLDWDARLLLSYEGNMSYRPELRRYLLALMKFNWSGWDLRWAGGRIAEIAVRLGIDPGSVRMNEDELDDLFSPPDWDLPPEEIGSTLTVIDGPEVGDYPFGIECSTTHLLGQGSAIFDRLSPRDVAHPTWDSGSSEILESGALIDRNGQSIDLGFVWGRNEGVVERLRARWPGWAIRRHEDGLPGHRDRSGRDPTFALIGENPAMQEIECLLFETDTFNPNAVLESLKSSGQEIQHVHPGFLKADRLTGDKSSKAAVFARALSEHRNDGSFPG